MAFSLLGFQRHEERHQVHKGEAPARAVSKQWVPRSLAPGESDYQTIYPTPPLLALEDRVFREAQFPHVACISGAGTPERPRCSGFFSPVRCGGAGACCLHPKKFNPAARTGRQRQTARSLSRSTRDIVRWGGSAPRSEGSPPATCAPRAIFLDILCARVLFSPQARLAGPLTPACLMRFVPPNCAEQERREATKIQTAVLGVTPRPLSDYFALRRGARSARPYPSHSLHDVSLRASG